SYDTAVTTPERLKSYLQQCGYQCDCYRRPGSIAQAGHPRVGMKEHPAMEHAGQVSAEAGRVTLKGEEHAPMEHGEHAGHGASMVADLLRRFIISVLLSLPLVIFS